MESSPISNSTFVLQMPFSFASIFGAHPHNSSCLNVATSLLDKYEDTPKYLFSGGKHRSALIPIDLLPKHRVNVGASTTNLASYIRGIDTTFKELTYRWIDKKGVHSRNVLFWKTVGTQLRNNGYADLSENEVEQIWSEAYFERRPSYSNEEKNLEVIPASLKMQVNDSRYSRNFNGIGDNIGCVLSDVLSDVLHKIHVDGDQICEMTPSLMLPKSSDSYLDAPILFGVFLKTEFIEEFYEAYETSCATTSLASTIGAKKYNSSLLPSFTNVLALQTSIKPEWFTVIYNKELYKTVKNSMSGAKKEFFKQYKQDIITDVLESGAEVITDARTMRNYTKRFKMDILSQLPNGLLDYEKESRDFLSTLSRID